MNPRARTADVVAIPPLTVSGVSIPRSMPVEPHDHLWNPCRAKPSCRQVHDNLASAPASNQHHKYVARWNFALTSDSSAPPDRVAGITIIYYNRVLSMTVPQLELYHPLSIHPSSSTG